MRGKIWEVRVEHERVQRRLLYFSAPERKFVMLHGFAKKTQKTPSKEIEVAEQRMRDYTGPPWAAKEEMRIGS